MSPHIVWIHRSRIEVHDRDVERWLAFFQQVGVEATINERPDADDVDDDVHYVLFPQADGIEVERADTPSTAGDRNTDSLSYMCDSSKEIREFSVYSCV